MAAGPSVVLPLNALELKKWSQLACDGGIGQAYALADHIANDTTSLMFLQGDTLTILAVIQGDEYSGTLLGECESVIGALPASKVRLLGPLKQPAREKRPAPATNEATPRARRKESPPDMHEDTAEQLSESLAYLDGEEAARTPRPPPAPRSHSANDSFVDLYRYSAVESSPGRNSVRDSTASGSVIDFTSFSHEASVKRTPDLRPLSNLDTSSGSLASQLRRRAGQGQSPPERSPETPKATEPLTPRATDRREAARPVSERNFVPPTGFSHMRPIALKVPHINVPQVRQSPATTSSMSTPGLNNSSSSGSTFPSRASSPESASSFESWVYRVAGMQPGSSPVLRGSPLQEVTSIPVKPVQLSPPVIIATDNTLQIPSPRDYDFTTTPSPPGEYHTFHSAGMAFEPVQPTKRLYPQGARPRADSSLQPAVTKEGKDRKQFYRQSYMQSMDAVHASDTNQQHSMHPADVPPLAAHRFKADRQPTSPESPGSRMNRENERKWIRLMSKYTLAQARRSHSSTLKKLVRLGVPPALRSKVWSYLLDVQAIRQPGLYDKIQSSDVRTSQHYMPILAHLDHCYMKEDVFKYRHTPGHHDVAVLLHSLDYFRPSLYNHALAYIARILLLHSPPEEAFWQLLAIAQLLPNTKQDVDAFIFAVDKLLAVSEPQLAALLARKGVLAHTTWGPLYVRSILAGILPTESALRLLDLICLEGTLMLSRGCLAVFDLIQDSLLAEGTDVRRLLGRPGPDLLDPVSFIPTLFTIKVKESALKKFTKQGLKGGG